MPNHLIDGLLERHPGSRLCLSCGPDKRSYTYGEVRDLSARYAAALESLGVRPGDRVAAQIEKSPEALFLYLGCVRAGAAFLPLNPAYTLSEIEYFISDAQPAVMLCDPSRRDSVAQIGVRRGVGAVQTLAADGTGSLTELASAQTPGWRDVDCGADDLAAILYTSGTTGRSKGAMLTHANLRSNAEVLVESWRFTANDVLIHALPIFHTHGLFVATNVCLTAGAAMIFRQKFDPQDVLSLLPQATVLMGVPTFYTRLLDQTGLTREASATMRLFVSGSAPLLADTHRAFRERIGHAILERYGMTETSMNTSNPYEGERVAGSVGFPLSGIEIRITDPGSGRVLPTGDIGMIEIRGPNVFSGYWQMPEKTRAEFRTDGFFVSGDLGRFDERGYLWIVGRGKDIVISGGFNVYPKEVELEIDALQGVAESAVVGLPHRDFGEAVTAVVVGNGKATPTEADIIASLRSRLAGYKLPKRVLFVDALPRNTMAKVQKNLLREQFKDLYA